jgi:voltage-gated potassium channel
MASRTCGRRRIHSTIRAVAQPERLVKALEWPMAIMALLVVPALVLENRATDPRLREIAHVINWIVWIAFCVEFAVRWAAARTWGFLRLAWFDLLLIVISPPFFVPDSLQSTRSLRALRILRLLRLVRAGAVATIGLRMSRRLFGRRKFHYTLLIATAVVFMGASGVFLFESESNRSIGSFGDALWWAVVTATTVGYGDVSPVTLEGRLIAVVLMLTGIGVIGLFTATVASVFFEEEKESEMAQVVAQLDLIEQKLDALLKRESVPDR